LEKDGGAKEKKRVDRVGVQEGGKEDKETRKLEKSEMCTECGRLGEKGEHIVSVYT